MINAERLFGICLWGAAVFMAGIGVGCYLWQSNPTLNATSALPQAALAYVNNCAQAGGVAAEWDGALVCATHPGKRKLDKSAQRDQHGIPHD